MPDWFHTAFVLLWLLAMLACMAGAIIMAYYVARGRNG